MTTMEKARERRRAAARKAAAARWKGHEKQKRREPKARALPAKQPTQVHPLVRQLMEARVLQKMSKRELSRRAGLSKGHVDGFERGQLSTPVLYTLNRLGDVLGLRLGWAAKDSVSLAGPSGAAIEEACAAMCQLCRKGVPTGRVEGKLRHVLEAADLPCKAAPIREKLLRQ